MDNKNIKILAIDDNQDNLITIKALTSEIYPGAKITTASSGKTGLELALAESPDVILLDIVMPGMDGFEVCEKLKANEILRDTPVIFVTANKDDKRTRIRALEVGAEAFLAKPVDESELKAQIRAMLKIKEANIEKRDENERLKALVDERTRELRRTYSATLNLLEDLKAENEARKKTEEALHESEEKYRFMTENVSDVIWHMDIDFCFDYVSPADERLRGYKPEEVVGTRLWDMLKPEGIDLVLGVVSKSKSSYDKQPNGLQFEFEVKTKDNRWIWVEVNVSLHVDDNGSVVGYHGVTRDITERKSVEFLLRESEEKFRDMANLLPQVVFEMTLDGCITYVNQQAQTVFGYEMNELLGLNSLVVHVPEERDRVEKSIRQKIAGRQPENKEFRMLRKDGSEFPALISINIIVKNNEPVGLRGVVIDITEQKEAEEKIRKSEEKFRDMAELLPQIIFEADINGNLTYVNKHAYEICGYDEHDQLIGMHASEFYAPVDKARSIENTKRRLAGETTDSQDYLMLRKDGTTFPVQVYANPIMVGDKSVGLRGIVVDVTEQKHAEEKIRESEQKYRELYTLMRLMSDTMPDMLWAKDLEGNYTFTNKAMCEKVLHAVDTKEPIGKPDIFFAKRERDLHPDNTQWHTFGEICLDTDKKTIREMRKMQFDEYGMVQGEFLYLDVHKAPLFNENNELIGVVGTARDITARKQAEDKLNYVARLYALLSQINQAIVRIKDVDQLLEKICQLSIEFGQFRMAWIGIYDSETRAINPMTSAGHADGYLDNLVIFPDDLNFGRGPTGRAFAESNMIFCNDIATDPIMNPWKGEALKRGYKSSFAAPLFRKGMPFGTITLYASEINFFDDEEQKLLQEVVEDIIYAIEAIDSEQERVAAEKALIESEAKYREFVENSPEAIAIYTDGIVTYVNKECLRLMRATSKDQLVGMSVVDFIHPDNRAIVIERMMKVAVSEVNISLPAVEEKYIRLDGTPIYVEVKVMPLMLDDKPAFQLTARDITDRKVIESALEKSRIELKTIYDYAPVMMCVVDENRCIQFANNAFTSLVGMHKDEMKGLPVGQVIDCINSMDDSRGCGYGPQCGSCNLRGAIEETFKTGVGLQNVEYQSALAVGGIVRDVSLLGSTAIIQTPEHRSLLLCLHDITDRKLAEEALQKSEMLLRIFIDNSPFEIWARDNENIGILENKKLVDHYGSIIGTTPESNPRIDKDTLRLWESNNARVFAGEMIDEECEFIVNEEPRIFQQIGFPIKINSKLIGIAGFNIDITDRKQAEEKIRENSVKLEMAMQVANMAWWEMNVKTGQVIFGKRKTDMLGFPSEEFVHYNYFSNLIHPDDYKKTMEAMENHIVGVTEKYEVEYRLQTSAGDYKWFYDIGSVSRRDFDGNPLIVSGLVLDITDRKNSEQELYTQKQFFEQMFMQSSLSTQILDREGWCERINPKLTKLFGVQAQHIEGHLYNIFDDEEIKRKGIVPKLRKVFDEGKTVEWEVYFDIAVAAQSQDVKIKRDKKAWFSNWAYPIKNQDGEVSHVIIQHTDITDKKLSEQALNESQEQLKKFAAHLQNVREEERVMLAREIHDQLGQILVAVKIDMGMLKMNVLKGIDKKHSEELHVKFDNLSVLIDNTIKTARKIMTDLRPEVLDMIGFIETVRQHLNSFQERHRVSCNLVTTDSHLDLSTQQSVALFRIIQEALNNIAKHAKATEVDVVINKQDKRLILEVADNGVGFDQDKKKNHDSYGLIGMQERVFLLEGELSIKSKVGKGTIVQVIVPLVGK